MTIHEVSRKLGISKGTIWRALNNADDIKPKTRERVLRQLDEVGYRPSRMAQALSTGRSQVVSVWMGSLTSNYATAVLYHLEQCIVGSSYDMLLRNLHYRSREEEARRPSAEWPTDGLMILDSIPWVAHAITRYKANPIPIVSMGVYCERSIDHVVIDLYEPVVAAMEHLLEQGARRIAFLTPKCILVPSQERYRAYCDVMRAAGLKPRLITTDDAHRREALEAVSAALRAGEGFDAIMAFDDEMAIGAYRALRIHDVDVPGDVALVGCDGMEEIEYLERPLSTIILPIPEMCQIAWRYLLQRIQNPDAPFQSTVLSAKLTIRESSVRNSAL